MVVGKYDEKDCWFLLLENDFLVGLIVYVIV